MTAMATGVSIWTTLPTTDVFSQVLAKLEFRTDLASANLVSRAWHAGLHRHLPYLGPLEFPSRLPVRLATQLELYTGVTYLSLQVRLPETQYQDLFVQHMIQALAAHPALRKLSFDDDRLDTETFRQLGSLTRLQSLCTRGNTPGHRREGWQDRTALSLFSDLTGLTELQVHSGGAQHSLEALRRMPLLQRLTLQVHPDADISPLASLRHLVSIDLQGTSAQVRQQYSQLTSLQQVHSFDIGKDATVRYLRPLTGLTSLHLMQPPAASEVVSLEALQHLRQLKYLHLDLQRAADLTALAALSELTMLQMSSCSHEPYNARPLAGLTRLHSFEYSGSNLLHASSLGQLARLEHLQLDCYGLIDLEWLSQLTRLRSLQLDQPLESEIDSVAELVALTSVRLNSADDYDVDCLEELTSLQSVCLLNSRITDVGFAADLHRLRVLNLHNSKELTDISDLQALPALRSLELGRCSRVDWPMLADLTTLTLLDVSYTSFVNYTLLSRLTNLRTLDVGGTILVGRSHFVRRMLPNLVTLMTAS